MEATFTPGFVLLLAGVGFLSLLIFLLLLLLCQRALKYKHGYRLPSLQVILCKLCLLNNFRLTYENNNSKSDFI